MHDEVFSVLERLVFEDYLTVTPALLTTLVPRVDASTAKKLLAHFAELHGDKLDILFLVTKRLADGRTLLAKTADVVSEAAAFVAPPVVYHLRMRGATESATAIDKRIADNLLMQISDLNSSLDKPLWRNPLAVAVASECTRRPVRAAPTIAAPAAKPQPAAKAQAQATTPGNPVAKPQATTTIASAFAKSATKRPIEEPKPKAKPQPQPQAQAQAQPQAQAQWQPAASASVVSVSSATMREEEEEEDVNMQQRSRKRQRVIDDEDDMHMDDQQPTQQQQQPAPSVSETETLRASAGEEPSEYKVKKKVTVTQISLSGNGYMEVEDVQQMQEEIVKRVEPPASSSRAERPMQSRPAAVSKSAPAGQRTLMDMFKKK